MPLQIAPGMMVGVADNEHPNQPVPYDPDQQRQFEQFQQYQQFLKYQEMQGQLPPGTPAPGPKKPPMWQKVLRSKMFRKLVLLVVVLIGLTWAYNYYFGPAPDDNTITGGAGPGTRDEPGRRIENPNVAIATLYRFVAMGDKNACTFFEKDAKQQFADDLGAPDCPTAVAQLASQVPIIDQPAVKWRGLKTVTVNSCRDIKVKPGDKVRRLGSFVYTDMGNGWTITGHAPEPDPCPAPTTTPPTTTSR
jgi:hypothetical protein